MGEATVKAVSQVAFHVVHRVNQPRVELNLPASEHLHRAGFADPALVVAIHICAHGELALFLRRGEQLADLRRVLERIAASLNRTGDGAGLYPQALARLLHADEHLRRGSHEVLAAAKIHEEAIRRRIAFQESVEGESAQWTPR